MNNNLLMCWLAMNVTDSWTECTVLTYWTLNYLRVHDIIFAGNLKNSMEGEYQRVAIGPPETVAIVWIIGDWL